MPTLIHRFALAGEEWEVPLARCKVVDKVRTWGVPLNDETADAIRLVASELITNAVVHGEGPVTVTLYHRTDRLVIDVVDCNSAAPLTSCARSGDESGRGLALVELLASHYAWEPAGRGKRVRAEITLPTAAPAIRAAVLAGFSRCDRGTGALPSLNRSPWRSRDGTARAAGDSAIRPCCGLPPYPSRHRSRHQGAHRVRAVGPHEWQARGECWLWSGGDDVEVTWIGPVRASGVLAALYACRACLYERDQRVLDTSMRHDVGVPPTHRGPARSSV